MKLSSLNDGQRAAVTAPEGPVLVVAGPGSGKTTVLTGRIAWLVQEYNVAPHNVLAITFSRKAARELQERLVRVMGEAGGQVDVCTFHSFGMKILKTFWHLLGYKSKDLNVVSKAEAQEMLLAAAKEAGLDEKPNRLALQAEQIRVSADPSPFDATIVGVAREYERRLRQRSYIDFTSMIAEPLRLFREHPDIREKYQKAAYRAVLCDEAQDTNASQYELLRAVAGGHRNITLVGDHLQQMYGWRGADGQWITLFLKDYPTTEAITLTQNYRSTVEIVEFSNKLARELDPNRSMWTANPRGERVAFYAAKDPEDEARHIASEIGKLWDEGKLHPRQVAVLFRNNAQSDPIAIHLREEGIAYRLRGSTDLFHRKEIRAVVAYLRLAHNVDDGLALAQIVNTPPRNLAAVAKRLAENPVSPVELPAVADLHGREAFAQAQGLLRLLTGLREEVRRGASPAEMIELVLERTGLGEWLAARADAEARLPNVAKLREVAARYEGNLGDWLADLQLDQLDDEENDPDALVLTTIHGSKGLEWDVVYGAGLEDGTLPSSYAIRGLPFNRRNYDEELCVLYVLATRAREKLKITHCGQRLDRDGNLEARSLSRFLLPYAPGYAKPRYIVE